MIDEHKSCQRVLERFGLSERCAQLSRLPWVVCLAVTILLPACKVYDPNLIQRWRDGGLGVSFVSVDGAVTDTWDTWDASAARALDDVEADNENAGDAAHSPVVDAWPGQDADDCVPNPQGDDACPWICAEVCDGWDNDCDGDIDEAEASKACALPNASSECIAGECAVLACLGQHDNCDGDDANGCETELDTLTDCGACGEPCTGASCAGGVCSDLNCDQGLADCDGESDNGCETSLGTDTDCSRCGDACAELPDPEHPNALAGGCADGACSISECEEGYEDCNRVYGDGCEVHIAGNASHCGSCGFACAELPYVNEVDCRTGSCVINNCEMGHADCNGDPSDGCERDLTSPEPPEPACTAATHAGHLYYFCGTASTWADARDLCLDACMDLVRIDDAAENSFVASEASADHWIGANDLESEGVWVWTQDGNQFWDSNTESDGLWSWLLDGPSGNAVGDLYANWAAGEPNDNNDSDCARISAENSGQWMDRECNISYGYICETDLSCQPCDSPGSCETAAGATCDEDGNCVYPADVAAPCDDEDPCTRADRCLADKSCAGTPYACNRPGLCETAAGASCNGDGTCSYLPDEGERCDDRNPCTHTDRCRADKSCVGTAYACDSPGFCETAVGATCDGDGSCTYPADQGGRCEDGNPCTHTDECQTDKLCAGTPYACADPGPCETAVGATCNGNGTCDYPADEDGTCDDEDPCTVDDQCQEDKSCAGTTYVCDSPDLCETEDGATCNGDGTCDYPPDVGEACDDENPCTADDQCQADKSCAGSIDVGAECQDGDDCTENDICDESGDCEGTPIEDCIGGDLCCPEGCTSPDDSDC